jgi:MOSC domain-containing protein YiiM
MTSRPDTYSKPGHRRVESVNVGGRRRVDWAGRVVETAIWKQPVHGRINATGVNLAGDDQADRRVHGGPDKAIYAYATDDYEWWSQQLGRELGPGTFGENLTVSGIDLAGALVGEQWRIGTTMLEVTQPRLPCFKLGIRMRDSGFVDRFEQAQRFGTYLRIIEDGTLAAGDAIEVIGRPGHGLTITDLGKASPRPGVEMIERILAVPEVPDSWREWAERARSRQARGSGESAPVHDA